MQLSTYIEFCRALIRWTELGSTGPRVLTPDDVSIFERVNERCWRCEFRRGLLPGSSDRSSSRSPGRLLLLIFHVLYPGLMRLLIMSKLVYNVTEFLYVVHMAIFLALPTGIIGFRAKKVASSFSQGREPLINDCLLSLSVTFPQL
jgi:hypothetical protein